MSRKGGAVGVLIVTHGGLARELVEAARVILGDHEGRRLRALSIGWDDAMDDARELVRESLAALDAGAGVLVLTDMFGGTPTNLCLSFLAEERVELVTGVNLPMVVKSLSLVRECDEGASLRSLADRIAARGGESVIVASSTLEPTGDGEGDEAQEA